MEENHLEEEKKRAAEAAIDYIKDGMLVGLGTGSTATYMIRALGKKVGEGLRITGVPSSEKTAELAQEVGIPLTTLAAAGTLDINIDGADEFDASLQLIKGGGGALLREKIIAHNANFNIIIADSGKQVSKLGAFKLPLETIPFATENIMAQLKEMGLDPVVRTMGKEQFRTDENNCIIDVDISQTEEVKALNKVLIAIPGIVETGLFLDFTDVLILGTGTKTEIFKREAIL